MADAPSISLADLGAQSTIAFYVSRDATSASLTFPVPTGLTPEELTAKIELPVDLRFGNLAVTQGDRTIHRQLLDYSETPPAVDGAGGSQDSWFWWAVGGVAAISALGALLILVRARRRESTP